MSKYQRVGTIKNISEIPFDKALILTGTLGSGWLWRMPGMFKKREGGIVFEDHCGCVSSVDETKINLAIMEVEK